VIPRKTDGLDTELSLALGITIIKYVLQKTIIDRRKIDVNEGI
jgi:hypothetical protein